MFFPGHTPLWVYCTMVLKGKKKHYDFGLLFVQMSVKLYVWQVIILCALPPTLLQIWRGSQRLVLHIHLSLSFATLFAFKYLFLFAIL